MHAKEEWIVKIGGMLTAARLARGLSLRGLERESGIARKSLSRYEDGLAFPPPKQRRLLGEALGIDISAWLREL